MKTGGANKSNAAQDKIKEKAIMEREKEEKKKKREEEQELAEQLAVSEPPSQSCFNK